MSRVTALGSKRGRCLCRTVQHIGWRAALPLAEQTLRAHQCHHHHKPELQRMGHRLRRREDDDRAARPAHPSLRHRRDRQRELALQEARLSTPSPDPTPGGFAQVGAQAPPARAAPSLVRALRDARGALLCTTWTSRQQPRSAGVKIGRRLTHGCLPGRKPSVRVSADAG